MRPLSPGTERSSSHLPPPRRRCASYTRCDRSNDRISRFAPRLLNPPMARATAPPGRADAAPGASGRPPPRTGTGSDTSACRSRRAARAPDTSAAPRAARAGASSARARSISSTPASTTRPSPAPASDALHREVDRGTDGQVELKSGRRPARVNPRSSTSMPATITAGSTQDQHGGRRTRCHTRSSDEAMTTSSTSENDPPGQQVDHQQHGDHGQLEAGIDPLEAARLPGRAGPGCARLCTWRWGSRRRRRPERASVQPPSDSIPTSQARDHEDEEHDVAAALLTARSGGWGAARRRTPRATSRRATGPTPQPGTSSGPQRTSTATSPTTAAHHLRRRSHPRAPAVGGEPAAPGRGSGPSGTGAASPAHGPSSRWRRPPRRPRRRRRRAAGRPRRC